MRRNRAKVILFSAFFVAAVIFGGILLQQWEKTHRRFTVEKYVKEETEGIAHALNSEITENKANEKNTEYININTAGIDELDKLPGIGEGLAKRIISYREEHGGFEVIEDLMRIPGIGEKRFEAICDLICVE